MIDKFIMLIECLDDRPAASLCFILALLASLGIIGCTIYNTCIDTAAIKAGLVEKRKIGYSGTYWTKPD